MSAFEGWAVLEVMGHRRHAGLVTEVSIAGAQMLRIDIPGPTASDPVQATHFYGGGSIFCLTPCTEELARREANPPKWSTYALPAPHEDDDETDAAGDEPDAD